MTPRPRLLFVSPRYLLPADTGAKIRTTDILRGLKGGRFEVILAAPAPGPRDCADPAALAELCDRFVSWPQGSRGVIYKLRRALHLLDPLPVSVACERSRAARRSIGAAFGEKPDIVVVDFPHTAVNVPAIAAATPSVLFTHNVEAEIFKRHAAVASDPLWRTIWRSQHRKMLVFEQRALGRFDVTVAVSQRDAEFFRSQYAIPEVSPIPTGVDLDHLAYSAPRVIEPGTPGKVVFVGSMDWMANIEGVEYFMKSIWPTIEAGRAGVNMVVVGRNPPAHLVNLSTSLRLPWSFTGFVDDVRPYLRDADVAVIPLRVGGGTRLKAYEAMAAGVPVVSTSVGVEGLPVEPGLHYECADDPTDFAAAVLDLLASNERRLRLSRSARSYVEANFGSRRVAQVFEQICFNTLRSTQADQPLARGELAN